MKKPFKALIGAAVALLICIIAAYIILAIFYQNVFQVNTWINGVYCAGRNVESVEDSLLAKLEHSDTLEVVGYANLGENTEEKTYTISMEELQFEISYENALRDQLSNQNPWLWFDSLGGTMEHSVIPSYSYDEVALLSFVDQITANFGEKELYAIEYTEADGYILKDTVHNRIDRDKVILVLQNALKNGHFKVNLIENGCYSDVPLTNEQQESEKLWKKIDAFQKNGPYYRFEEVMQVGSAQMADLLEKNSATMMPFIDENGAFIFKLDYAEHFIDQLANEHDTVGKMWSFTSTRGENLEIEGKTYGSAMNREREAAWFETYISNLEAGRKSSLDTAEGNSQNPRVPLYEKEAYGGYEIGNTYIEADLGSQMLYFYKDGELVFETEIVSGNMKRKWDTPTGVNYVYMKQKNRVLRGPGYATPVKFWMPVNGSIGIHDANWRDEFGGEIYKTNGSHGCMNVPPEKMAELYDMIEVGIPVVMFYGTDPVTGETIVCSKK